MMKFSLYSKLVWVISTPYGLGKLLEHFILIVVTLLLSQYFAFLTVLRVCDKFELLGNVQTAMMI